MSLNSVHAFETAFGLNIQVIRYKLDYVSPTSSTRGYYNYLFQRLLRSTAKNFKLATRNYTANPKREEADSWV